MAGDYRNKLPENVESVWYLTRDLHVRYETSYVVGKLAITLFGRDGMEYKFLRNGKTWRLLQGADIDAWPENLYYKIEKMLNKIAGNSVNEVIEEA